MVMMYGFIFSMIILQCSFHLFIARRLCSRWEHSAMVILVIYLRYTSLVYPDKGNTYFRVWIFVTTNFV